MSLPKPCLACASVLVENVLHVRYIQSGAIRRQTHLILYQLTAQVPARSRMQLVTAPAVWQQAVDGHIETAKGCRAQGWHSDVASNKSCIMPSS